MRIRITGPGIYANTGEEIAVGTELTVKGEPTGWAGRYTVLSGGKTDDEKVAITNSDAATPVLPLVAADHGGGWWAVTDADGKGWGKKLRKDDAEAFNALTDDEKVELVSGED